MTVRPITRVHGQSFCKPGQRRLMRPLSSLVTVRGGTMSVAMTDCGELGSIADKSRYRYVSIDPASDGRACRRFSRALAADVAAASGLADFLPDACRINRYVPGARLSLQQDRNERDSARRLCRFFSVCPRPFCWGGPTRSETAGKRLYTETSLSGEVPAHNI